MTGHQHEAHGHTHGASPDADWRWLAAAAALIAAFMVGEVAAGLIAHSLAKGPGVNPLGDEALAILAAEPAMADVLVAGQW